MVRGAAAPPVVKFFGQNCYDSGKSTWRKLKKHSHWLIKQVLRIKFSRITTQVSNIELNFFFQATRSPPFQVQKHLYAYGYFNFTSMHCKKLTPTFYLLCYDLSRLLCLYEPETPTAKKYSLESLHEKAPPILLFLHKMQNSRKNENPFYSKDIYYISQRCTCTGNSNFTGRTVEYGQQNWPITACVLSNRYILPDNQTPLFCKYKYTPICLILHQIP